MSAGRATRVLAAVLLAGTLAACSGGGSDAKDASGEGVARAPAESGGGRPGAAAGSAERGSGGGGQGGTRSRAPLAEARKVIHSAELRVRADDVEASAARAKEMAAGAGGYVERETSSSRPPRSEITLKIPADRYGEVLNRLSTQLGTKLMLTQQAEDVTGEVADVAARVRSAEAALASLRKLYERADGINEILRLENEIAEREADLEALQARQKSLKHSTDFATVTVTLVPKDAPVQEKEDERQGGFIGGLKSGWNAFTVFIGGAAMVFGWLLPFLVTAAVLGAPVVVLRHRLRERFLGGRRNG